MSHSHHAFFVGLSLVVAVLGSWTALDLFRRVRSHIGRARGVWLGSAAVAMGASIWSMHFIAMLGFDPGSPVRYDLPLTFLSLALAVGATCSAFFAASRPRTSLGGVIVAGATMGAGICLMHYVGMAAVRGAVSLGYRPAYVLASFAIAVSASTAALLAAQRERAVGWRIAASLILGVAIAGMHYTAMAGLRLAMPMGGGPISPGAPPFVLGAGVAAVTVMILFLAMLASVYDQRLNVLSALDAGRVGYWELTLPDMRLQLSPVGKQIFGLAADAPFDEPALRAALSDEEYRRRERLIARAVATRSEYDAEYAIRTPDGEARWINIRGRVIGGAGRARRMSGVVLDITDRRAAFQALAEAERRQRLLIDELNHRVKNTLATVQSIARQTARGRSSVEDYVEAFEGRLIALSRTHNALTRGGWERADVRELLEAEFSPFAEEQRRLDGPAVELNARQALALGMVFHELATNAAKYGALSRPAGCIEVAWRVSAEPAVLHVRWSERGGPEASEPARAGFGSRLIRAEVEGELGGALRLSYPASGLVCEIEAPLPCAAPAHGLQDFFQTPSSDPL